MVATLMHKDFAVARLELDETTGLIRRVVEVSLPQHLPVGTRSPRGNVDRSLLNEWWADRSIPAGRPGVREALERMGLPDPKLLPLRSMGLSLSDHYWLRPQGCTLCWEEVSFFTAPFSGHVGDALFGRPAADGPFDFRSPDNTTDGYLKKRWVTMDGRPVLLKGGSAPYRQQPFNEVIAFTLSERLHIPHIPYSLRWAEGAPYSACEGFLSPNTELVTAWRILQTGKKSNSTSLYQHFVNCCRALGAGDVTPALDRMITLDYLIANEDRHLNNFGLLRDPDTLEWLGMAPLFDSGSCLGYDKTADQIQGACPAVCKPFKKRHTDQLGLVSSFHWLDFDALAGVDELVHESFSQMGAEAIVGQDRIDAIADTALTRARFLCHTAPGRSADTASPAGDVEKNIAADYSQT